MNDTSGLAGILRGWILFLDKVYGGCTMGAMVKVDEKKTVVIGIRLSPTEAENLELAAEAAGLSVGEFVRRCIDMGGVVGQHKELIGTVLKELQKAMVEVIRRREPVGKKSA
jgi:ribosomal protein L30E